jgi:hypothetical protein
MQLSNALPLTTVEGFKPQKTINNHQQIVIPDLPLESEQPIDPTPTLGLSIVPELVEVETVEIESRTEFTTTFETETRTTFHIVEDVPQEQELVPAVEDEPEYPEEVPNSEQDTWLEETPSVTEEPSTVEESPAPKTQSTSRWAEVLFGTKDDED